MTELGLILCTSLLGLGFCGLLVRWVLSRPVGEADMARVAHAVRRAAEAFARREASTILAVSALLGGAVFLAYGLRQDHPHDPVSGLELGVWLTASFALGAVSSVGLLRASLWLGTRASIRVAGGARRSVDQALQLSVRGAAAIGCLAVSAAMLGLVALFGLAFFVKGGTTSADAHRLLPSVPTLILGFPLGASFSALLAQVGGGFFAKGADVGSDVAAREFGLADDDAQNPAAIADLAGDNVADCAGRAMAVFQAASAEATAAMLIAAELFRRNEQLESALAVLLFPLVVRAFGLVGACFGVMVIRTDDREEPISALGRGLWVATLLLVFGAAGSAKWLLGPTWLIWAGCAAIGAASVVVAFFAVQYFTEQRFRPVRDLAEASRSGPSLSVMTGLTGALDAIVIPLLLLVLSLAGCYHLGSLSGLAGGGAFGVACLMLGMGGVATYLVAVDTFGALVDNAGGIVSMTIGRERPEVRGRTVLLDQAGSSIKAVSRVVGGGMLALSSLLLLLAFYAEANKRMGQSPGESTLGVGVGVVLGVLLVGWFAARCLAGVSRAARRMIDEVRRQLRDSPLAIDEEGETKSRAGLPRNADPDACVELVARFALRHMIAPALVATLCPLVFWLCLRFVTPSDNSVSADPIAALLLGAAVAGVFVTSLFGAAGGAWDNAKKYIVTGAHGGRTLVDEAGTRMENPTYFSAVVADTLGDSLKDATGSALAVLCAVLPLISLVLLPFFS